MGPSFKHSWLQFLVNAFPSEHLMGSC
jgi:hypothetical protein